MISEEFKKYIHPTKNIFLDIGKINNGSNKEIWWKVECGHEFKKQVKAFCISKNRCPYCSKTRKRILVGFNDLNTKNKKITKEWHSTKNGDLLPTMVTEHTHKKVWWICEKNHEWEASIYSRTTKSKLGPEGAGCPFCSGRYASKTNNFAIKCPQFLYLWHPVNNLPKTPFDFTFKSQQKVWWLCSCGHEWKAVIHGITRGCGCPKCRLKKSRNTSLKKYGTNNPQQNILIAKKQARKANYSFITKHWKTNEEIVCVGSYEKLTIEYLNNKKIDYIWQNKMEIPNNIPIIGGLIYFIDLYFPYQNEYAEIKGWIDRNKITKLKWEWFHETYPNSELWDKVKLKSLSIKVR